MTRRVLVALLFAAELSAAQTPSPLADVVETYCARCHDGQRLSPSEKLLESFDAGEIAARPKLWASAYRQIQAGAMPPAGADRPDRTTVAATLTAIEAGLAGNVAAGPAPESLQLASTLATVLWRTAPDAALLQDAQRNRLADPAVLEGHVRRMLADDRAQAFVANFFLPWLQLDKLSSVQPDRMFFPDYQPTLRDALAKETELFLLSQLRDDRDPVALWNANYTYLNEQLAKHYGVANVTGPQFRRVDLSATPRAGLLGQGSILMIMSRAPNTPDPRYTSPANRAVWIRQHFLGVTPPGAFPGAEPLKPELPITPQTRTLAKNPCGNCHRNFFPLGYALENFDPIGQWRTSDKLGPVDASGAFVDGTTFNGAAGLRGVLLQYPDAFRTAITEQLLAYATDARPGAVRSSPEELVLARRILGGMTRPRWSAIIAGVVRASAASPPPVTAARTPPSAALPSPPPRPGS